MPEAYLPNFGVQEAKPHRRERKEVRATARDSNLLFYVCDKVATITRLACDISLLHFDM